MRYYQFLFTPQENGDDSCESEGLQRIVQYPFSVNEKVLIKVSIVLVIFLTAHVVDQHKVYDTRSKCAGK